MMWCCSCARERQLGLLDTPFKDNMSTVKTQALMSYDSLASRTILMVKLEYMAKMSRRSDTKILKMRSAEKIEERAHGRLEIEKIEEILDTNSPLNPSPISERRTRVLTAKPNQPTPFL
jgi:hypothetical protein